MNRFIVIVIFVWYYCYGQAQGIDSIGWRSVFTEP